MKFFQKTTLVMAAIMTMNESQARQMEREAPNITAKYEVLIDAPIEAVWQALALDYGGIGKWASGVNHVVEFSGERITAKRSCEINAAGFNDTREKIIRFEPEDYYFEYDLYGGLPGMVAYSINKDQLIAEDGKTHWISENEMLVKGILGKTMKGFMRKKLEDVLSDKGQELKHYIETGKPHPNKLKAIREKEEKDLKMRKKMVSFEVIQEIQAPVSRVWRVVAEDFGNVHLSNPIATHSAYLDGYDRPVVGAKRIMYMSENRKKYFVDRLAKLDPEKHLTIEIAEKKGFPIRPAYTWVNMDLEALASGATELTIRFNYLTKPGFLKGLAKSGLKKNFKEYAWAIDHHVMTGEAISSDNWKDIRKKYK